MNYFSVPNGNWNEMRLRWNLLFVNCYCQWQVCNAVIVQYWNHSKLMNVSSGYSIWFMYKIQITFKEKIKFTKCMDFTACLHDIIGLLYYISVIWASKFLKYFTRQVQIKAFHESSQIPGTCLVLLTKLLFPVFLVPYLWNKLQVT